MILHAKGELRWPRKRRINSRATCGSSNTYVAIQTVEAYLISAKSVKPRSIRENFDGQVRGMPHGNRHHWRSSRLFVHTSLSWGYMRNSIFWHPGSVPLPHPCAHTYNEFCTVSLHICCKDRKFAWPFRRDSTCMDRHG